MQLLQSLGSVFTASDTNKVSNTKLGAFLAALGALAAVWGWSVAIDPRWTETLVIVGALFGVNGLREAIGRASAAK